jgi:hypothetical protein
MLKWHAKTQRPVGVWHKKAGSRLNDTSPWSNLVQKTPELLSLVSQTVLRRPLSYHPFLPISALEAVLCQHIPLPPHLKSWHPPPFLLDNFLGISSQAVHFPPYLLILFRTPTICRQMQAFGGREHPAWTGCTTLLSLLPRDRVPILTSSARENLDHLTPSRYVFHFLVIYLIY